MPPKATDEIQFQLAEKVSPRLAYSRTCDVSSSNMHEISTDPAEAESLKPEKIKNGDSNLPTYHHRHR